MFKWLFCTERNVILMVILNAAIITLLYFPQFEDNVILGTVDKAITLLFVMEAMTKIRVQGTRAYFSDGWNRFDFFLTVLSAPSLLVGVIPLPDTSILLLARLFRLVRLIRLFRFVPHIDQLLSGLVRALKASFLIMAVLAFANFMTAMMTCHFFRDLSPELFGNPFIAMYTMFQVFTIEGWNSIPQEIATAISTSDNQWSQVSREFLISLTRFYFATVVLFGGVFGLSLANAIFVDEMTIDNTDEMESKIDDIQRQLNRIQSLLESRVQNQ